MLGMHCYIRAFEWIVKEKFIIDYYSLHVILPKMTKTQPGSTWDEIK